MRIIFINHERYSFYKLLKTIRRDTNPFPDAVNKMAQQIWWDNTVKMLELLREREAQRLANNVPLALGELSDFIRGRIESGSHVAIYIAVPSKVVEEQVREWALGDWFHVESFDHVTNRVLCISWDTVFDKTFTIDGRFLHDGKLVLLKAH